MTEEKLAELRVKIAYNVVQGIMAAGDYDEWLSSAAIVEYAYEIADEILRQGDYNV